VTTPAPAKERDITKLLEDVRHACPFPDVSEADEHGLLAYGGDLSPERLICAYASGIFPWFDEPPILWFSPDPRMVLVPGELHMTRSLRKTVDRERYAVHFDRNFEQVIRACGAVPRPGQDGTWITEDMIEAYCSLHALGFAHSVEAYEDGELVGGCYGVSLGSAFFGESMFAHRSDASKVAFVHLTRRLVEWGFEFVDCQVHTDHLERLGARLWDRPRFLQSLETSLASATRVGSWDIADR
jgi:leucyl/phenylalanyl-tRNA--protein transferase